MKKIAAISTLLILLFNIVGYRFMFNYFEHNAIAKLEQKIDAVAYNSNELQELRIPLNMPYYADKFEEQAYGEIEIDGKHYQYVKQKIENNVLHIWCLPNTERNTIKTVKTDFAKSSSDNSNNNQSKKNSIVKLLQAEFLPSQQSEIVSAETLIHKDLQASNNFCFSQFSPANVAQPPELI